jgi:UDP-N-acetylmuramoylalanine--D-glutamate ligase
MILEGKKVLVVGLGKTGEALCRFLLNHGARVMISEKKNSEEMSQKFFLWKKRGVRVESGAHELESFLGSDFIFPSPGVPMIPELAAARKRGIKIISEIELAYKFLRGKIIGITGSNGKSTTATLTHKILKEGGLKAFLAGNIGTPLISFVENSEDDHVYVTEISSFQLEYVDEFKAPISVFLNISPDHLDWHSSFAAYFGAKKKLLAAQTEDDIAILNRDDLRVWRLEKESKARVYAFSRERKVSPGCYTEGGWVVLQDKKEERLLRSAEIPLIGIHNQENIMASSLVGHVFGLSLPQIKKSIKGFKGLEHRLEKVLTIKGIDFYNDSKATNVDATLKSIQSFDRKIILILGGRDKGSDFHKLAKAIREKVKKTILIGEAKEKIARALNNTVPSESVYSLREAVRTGYSEARPGEIILLSPACTSFDMFQNFEERGKVFKQEIFALEQSLEKELR